MRFKQFYLQEKFFKGMKAKLFPGDDGTYAEVFVNPDSNEINGILKDSEFKVVRLGIDRKNNLYAWKGEVMHMGMIKALKMDFPYRFDFSPKNPFVIVTGEGMNKRNWKKEIQYKAVNRLKDAFPKVKTLESLMGKDILKI